MAWCLYRSAWYFLEPVTSLGITTRSTKPEPTLQVGSVRPEASGLDLNYKLPVPTIYHSTSNCTSNCTSIRLTHISEKGHLGIILTIASVLPSSTGTSHDTLVSTVLMGINNNFTGTLKSGNHISPAFHPSVFQLVL
ncbi:hypothetical protein QCA50_015006 [Cerrena zonata]|uniref:Uncharacterized protein n=1 Tax=Cerrena zonata TaxID=2478898 RepID=A0AAW0FPI7_9APHY